MKQSSFAISNFFLLLKYIIFVVVILCGVPLILSAQPSTHFVTTWKTDAPGPSNNTSIEIPTTGSGYNYDVDWDNDGTFDEFGLTGSVTHDFGVAGTYTVRITGDFPRIHFNDGGDKNKIRSIEQWGNIAWASMQGAFHGCSSLTINAADNPDLSSVTNMSSMFRDCHVTGDFSGWDTANVTNMSSMFRDTDSPCTGIENWNTANVTNFAHMFYGAQYFNIDINGWDTGSATNMSNMFRNAVAFNQDIGGWNTASVTNMSFMFWNAFDFNHDIGGWNTANVTNMTFMFAGAVAFNWDIGGWNTANVTDMSYMFRSADAFNWDIGGWNTANVTDMSNMFRTAGAFDQDLGNWNIENVNNMVDMLWGCGLSDDNYDSTLIGWASQTVQPGITLHANGLKYCLGANARATLTGAPNNWSINGDGIDCDAHFPFGFITTWEVTGAGETITIPTTGGGYGYNIDWGDGTASGGHAGGETHAYASAGTYTVRIIGDFPRIYFNNGGDKNKIRTIEQWGNIAWASMGRAFRGASSLTCTATDTPDLSGVTDLSRMFQGCSSLNSNFNPWNTANITDMSFMFAGASSFNGKVQAWNTSNVTNMESMFAGASSFNKKILFWNTSKVTNMSSMFAQATSFNKDISLWNTSKVTDMTTMFILATSFDQDIGGWDISSVSNMNGMFSGAELFVDNYDALLIGWNTLDPGEMQVPSGVSFHGGFSNYCNGEPARSNLISSHGWSIIDGGEDCSQALPVEWLYFQTEAMDKQQCLLTWATATETNSAHFVVEHSVDGHHFREIGTVEAEGYSSEVVMYDFIHETPVGGFNYYRLKQFDYDGIFEYSEIRSVKIEGNNIAVKVFPNPFHLAHDDATVQFTLSESTHCFVEIFNLQGQQVWQTERDFLEAGAHALSWNGQTMDKGQLTTGMYFIKLHVGEQVFTEKLSVVGE